MRFNLCASLVLPVLVVTGLGLFLPSTTAKDDG